MKIGKLEKMDEDTKKVVEMLDLGIPEQMKPGGTNDKIPGGPKPRLSRLEKFHILT